MECCSGGWWGGGGVIGGISDGVVVLSFCSPVVVVGLCSPDVCSLFFCSCIIGFSSLLSGCFVEVERGEGGYSGGVVVGGLVGGGVIGGISGDVVVLVFLFCYSCGWSSFSRCLFLVLP